MLGGLCRVWGGRRGVGGVDGGRTRGRLDGRAVVVVAAVAAVVVGGVRAAAAAVEVVVGAGWAVAMRTH